MQYFTSSETFGTERGGTLEGLTIAYNTYGSLNVESNNVIWICHALTANSEVERWWPEMIGAGKCFDTNKYFVVCANLLGSCYGTTGPLSVNPNTGTPYFSDFPSITIRDMVRAHQLLKEHLGVSRVALLVGGSMGGYQALEWCVMEPALFDSMFLIATAAKESAWRKAIHTAQRIAIEADASWGEAHEAAGSKGLKAARSIGMIAYRNFETYAATQDDDDPEEMENFKAASYIEYQGKKFVDRFNAFSYWLLTWAMDSHHIARGRKQNLAKTLQSIAQKTLIIGINSDILCPLSEQVFMSEHIPHATFISIDSIYGHDGFLVETSQITTHLQKWLQPATVTLS